MPYRADSDLEFLGRVDSRDLDDLVHCLTHDKDGSKRLTEDLTYKDSYKQHFPNHHMYWRDVACEIQCFGGNTFVTLFRGGEGVLYREVLTDVCDKVGAEYKKESTVEEVEICLLLKIFIDSVGKMTREELADLARTIGVKNIGPNLGKDAMLAACLVAFRMGGFASYQLAMIVVNAVARILIGRGLAFGANAALTRILAVVAGPIGWAITGIWTAVDIASPAYRVTIPAVLLVAAIRQKHLHGRDANGSVIGPIA